MLEFPGRQFDVGGAVTLALEVPVYLGKPQSQFIEVVARIDDLNVGFSMLFEDRGKLFIENPMWGYCRPNLEYRTFVGIEVRPEPKRGANSSQWNQPGHNRSHFSCKGS